MALPQPKPRMLPFAEERRRFQRVRVNLLGRYMLADRREFPCQVSDMSPGGMALIAPVTGAIGERVVAYVDHLGRLEGSSPARSRTASPRPSRRRSRKRDKLAAQLTWLANRHILNMPEDRRHGRIVPRNPAARLQFCRKGSTSGCGIGRHLAVRRGGIADRAPARRSAAWSRLGKIPGRVVRHLWKMASPSSSPGCSTRDFAGRERHGRVNAAFPRSARLAAAEPAPNRLPPAPDQSNIRIRP